MKRSYMMAVVLTLVASSAQADVITFDYSATLDNTYDWGSNGVSTISGNASAVTDDVNFGATDFGDFSIDILASNQLSVSYSTTTPLGGNPTTVSLSNFDTGGETIASWALVGGTNPVFASGPVLTASSIDFSIRADHTFGDSFNWIFQYTAAGGGGAAVPEPSSLAGLGLLGVGAFWIRRKKQVA